MTPSGRRRLWALAALCLGLARGLVDESGRYRQGGDFSSLVPPEPSEEDRNAAVDLSKQPVDRLFKLLAYELFREETRPPEPRLGVRQFQLATELGCAERYIAMADAAQQVSEEVRIYHLNITGTAGLFWLLHEYPEEHSWVWLISVSHERVLRKVAHHFSRLAAFALDDAAGCLSPNFRTVLMNSAATWRRLQADQIALLWNGIAFGILGDVTSWREIDDDGQAADEPGGPPPNVSWSENLIFGNMWVSSIQKWLEHNAHEVNQAAYTELARAQAGVPPDPNAHHWLRGQNGVLSSFEFLRRQLFGGWPLDKGLLRGMLRHCLQPGYGASRPPTVGDFGAGGGRYSQWLNETGLVEAFAVDAAYAVGDITGGAVQELDLAADVQLWRTFDWVLCLDVVASLPATQAGTLLRNIRRHAERGLVMSWPSASAAAPSEAAVGAASLSESDFVGLVERETGFKVDWDTTRVLRSGCELGRLGKGVAVFKAAV